MRPFFRPLALALIASFALLGAPPPAAAQDKDDTEENGGDDSADVLLRHALADMEAKNYDAACPALKKSYRKDAKPSTLFTLAECEEKAGRITTGALTYDDYLALYDRLSPTEQKDEREREQKASSRRQALEPVLPRVMFKLKSSAPTGTKVSRIPRGGGDPLEVSVDVFIPIDPGEHFVITEAPGRPRTDTRFSINKGERKTVELDVALPRGETQLQAGAPLRPVASLLPPLDPPMPPRRVTAYVLGGIGVASVIGGVVTGALVWGQKGTIADNCKKGVCNPNGESASDLAYVSGIVSTVTFAVGGAALAGSVILFLTEPAPPKLGSAAPRLAIKAGVSPTGGASLGLHGVW